VNKQKKGGRSEVRFSISICTEKKRKEEEKKKTKKYLIFTTLFLLICLCVWTKRKRKDCQTKGRKKKKEKGREERVTKRFLKARSLWAIFCSDKYTIPRHASIIIPIQSSKEISFWLTKLSKLPFSINSNTSKAKYFSISTFKKRKMERKENKKSTMYWVSLER
jgi:hypothetical protein